MFSLGFSKPTFRSVAYENVTFSTKVFGPSDIISAVDKNRQSVFQHIKIKWLEYGNKEELLAYVKTTPQFTALAQAFSRTGVNKAIVDLLSEIGSAPSKHFSNGEASTDLALGDVKAIIEALKDPEKAIRNSKYRGI